LEKTTENNKMVRDAMPCVLTARRSLSVWRAGLPMCTCVCVCSFFPSLSLSPNFTRLMLVHWPAVPRLCQRTQWNNKTKTENNQPTKYLPNERSREEEEEENKIKGK
jgi:hypothetical protein